MLCETSLRLMSHPQKGEPMGWTNSVWHNHQVSALCQVECGSLLCNFNDTRSQMTMVMLVRMLVVDGMVMASDGGDDDNAEDDTRCE